MADYYPILARAVLSLETNNAQARQELYEHARAILVAQLPRQDPQISALVTMAEQVVLETAILRVEAESRSIGERSPETFADYVPEPTPEVPEPTPENGILGMVPDFASLLREPATQPLRYTEPS